MRMLKMIEKNNCSLISFLFYLHLWEIQTSSPSLVGRMTFLGNWEAEGSGQGSVQIWNWMRTLKTSSSTVDSRTRPPYLPSIDPKSSIVTSTPWGLGDWSFTYAAPRYRFLSMLELNWMLFKGFGQLRHRPSLAAKASCFLFLCTICFPLLHVSDLIDKSRPRARLNIVQWTQSKVSKFVCGKRRKI